MEKYLKFVSDSFLLVRSLSLKESTYESRKNVCCFTSKAPFQVNQNLVNRISKQSLWMKFGQFKKGQELVFRSHFS